MPSYDTATPFPVGGTKPHPRRRRLRDIPLIGPALAYLAAPWSQHADTTAALLQHADRLSTLERDALMTAPDRDLASKLLATLPILFDKVRAAIGDSAAKDQENAELRARLAAAEGRADAADAAAAADAEGDAATWKPVADLLDEFEKAVLPAAQTAPDVIPVVTPEQVAPVLAGDVATDDVANSEPGNVADPATATADPVDPPAGDTGTSSSAEL